MILIDTHAHLYSKEFKDDSKDLIQRAFDAGVARVYLPAIDSEVIDDMLKLEETYPGKFFAMMGLHPCSVNENYKDELDIVKRWLDKRSFAAIGEVGLDFYWDTTFAKEQFEAFNLQMQWALDLNKPLVIHTRKAMRETIDTVKPFADKGLTGIFHCFGGNAKEASEIIAMGFYLGIGGVLTYKNAGLVSVLENISLEHIVLETDAPYLTPVPYRGKRNESSYLTYIAAKLAEVKNVSVEEVGEITTANAEKIFGS